MSGSGELFFVLHHEGNVIRNGSNRQHTVGKGRILETTSSASDVLSSSLLPSSPPNFDLEVFIGMIQSNLQRNSELGLLVHSQDVLDMDIMLLVSV